MPKKKSSEIKPGETAEVVDQETQVEKVQELTTEQMDNTPIEPGTIIVDPSVETDPVEEGPVLDEPLTEKEQAKLDAEYVDPADTLNPSEEAEFDKKAEKKLAGNDETKEPTRYGAGKEVIADQIEEGGDSRHYSPPLHGDPTGGKNEYPR
jgi:hypothetical protein